VHSNLGIKAHSTIIIQDRIETEIFFSITAI